MKTQKDHKGKFEKEFKQKLNEVYRDISGDLEEVLRQVGVVEKARNQMVMDLWQRFGEYEKEAGRLGEKQPGGQEMREDFEKEIQNLEIKRAILKYKRADMDDVEKIDEIINDLNNRNWMINECEKVHKNGAVVMNISELKAGT